MKKELLFLLTGMILGIAFLTSLTKAQELIQINPDPKLDPDNITQITLHTNRSKCADLVLIHTVSDLPAYCYHYMINQ